MSASEAGSRLGLTRLRPAYEQVADQLRQLILVGDLKPGDRLPVEGRLCEIFGVSRSTVREAVRLLAAQDLVFTTRGTTGGTFVSSIDPDAVSAYLAVRLSLMTDADTIRVDELLEARELLEVPAARLAAERASEEQRAGLLAAAEREREARLRPGSFLEHKEFHALLVEASGNRLLSLMNRPTFQVLQQSRFPRSEMPRDFWDEVDRDHRRIATLVTAGDADGAAAATHEHLVQLRRLYSPRD